MILRFAKENPSWGYDRIQGALANVGYHISDQTVGNVLKQHGIEPAPDRKRQTTWKTFLKSHWDVLAAIDFTTIEVWTKGGLVTYYLLFVMDVASRRVHLAACTPTLGDQFMKQVARNLTDTFDGFLNGKRHVLVDRDANFSFAFRRILEDAGVKPVRLPPKSPNLTGVPAMSGPLYWKDESLPIGAHFFGRYGGEATLLRLAGQLEQAQPWAHKRPPEANLL